MSRRALALAALTLAALLAGSARADQLVLKDGRMVDGVKIVKKDDGVDLLYEHGTVHVRADLVDEVTIDGTPAYEPRTDEEREMREKGFVRWNKRWVTVEYREKKLREEQEKRVAQLAEEARHRNWVDRYQFETKHFKFESTLPPAINEEYSALMETYFEEFSKLWKTRVPKDWGKLTVCFHRDLKSFEEIGGAPRGVIGYYRFVEPRELHFFHDRRQPANTLAVMFHETNHYLTDLLDERFQYPHWVNEAMAEYYGSATWDPATKSMQVGAIQMGRLAELQADVAAEKFFPLSDLLADESRDYRHYYWGWSFVHFMMESPKYSAGFRSFFSELARGRGVDHKAFGMNFTTVSGEVCRDLFLKKVKVKDLDALQDEWYAYIRGLQGGGVLALEQAGTSAFRQGRWKFRAPRLLKEAIDAGSRNAQVYVTYAKCLLLKGEGDEAALKVLEQATQVDPLDAAVWAELGYHLLNMQRKAESERIIALAKEIDPEVDLLNLEIARVLASGDDD